MTPVKKIIIIYIFTALLYYGIGRLQGFYDGINFMVDIFPLKETFSPLLGI